jgi:N-acetylmuramoyl-L-alanine amidase
VTSRALAPADAVRAVALSLGLAGAVFLLCGAASQPSQKSSPARPASSASQANGKSNAVAPTNGTRLPAPEPVNLSSFARTFGLDHVWAAPAKQLRLKNRWTNILFEVGTREIGLNGIRVFLGEAAAPAKKSLAISPIDRDRLLLPVIAPQNLAVREPLRVIALDPGHGGRDNGTRNAALKLEEKNLTLDVARRAKALLEARGFKVVLTRTDDSYVGLSERPQRATAAGADVLVSIHFNAAEKPDVRGVETYTLTPQFQRSTGSDELRPDDAVAVPGNAFDTWSTFLGYTLHRQLKTDLGMPDRGLKRARFQVLRELATAPAVLVECGYLSHPEEARLVGTARYRQELAAAIADGISEYNRTLVRLADARAAEKKSTSVASGAR